MPAEDIRTIPIQLSPQVMPPPGSTLLQDCNHLYSFRTAPEPNPIHRKPQLKGIPRRYLQWSSGVLRLFTAEDGQAIPFLGERNNQKCLQIGTEASIVNAVRFEVNNRPKEHKPAPLKVLCSKKSDVGQLLAFGYNVSKASSPAYVHRIYIQPENLKHTGLLCDMDRCKSLGETGLAFIRAIPLEKYNVLHSESMTNSARLGRWLFKVGF